MAADPNASIQGGVGEAVAHDSSGLHVSGEATYIDDIREPAGLLHLAIGMSSKPHARITAINLDAVKAAPGVVRGSLTSKLIG